MGFLQLASYVCYSGTRRSSCSIRESSLQTDAESHKVGSNSLIGEQAMPTADYNKIQAAIVDTSSTTPSQALEGMYAGDTGTIPRRFLAYALGDGIPGSGTEEVVLGWQYDGYHTDSDPNKNWRCFKVASFTGSVGSKLTSIP